MPWATTCLDLTIARIESCGPTLFPEDDTPRREPGRQRYRVGGSSDAVRLGQRLAREEGFVAGRESVLNAIESEVMAGEDLGERCERCGEPMEAVTWACRGCKVNKSRGTVETRSRRPLVIQPEDGTGRAPQGTEGGGAGEPENGTRKSRGPVEPPPSPSADYEPSEEEVERGARAIMNKRRGFPDAWDEYSTNAQRMFACEEFRAGLRAAREPQ
jgi:hypothetical protein